MSLQQLLQLRMKRAATLLLVTLLMLTIVLALILIPVLLIVWMPLVLVMLQLSALAGVRSGRRISSRHSG